MTAQWCQNVFNFDYTGKEQIFNSSDSCGAGYYKLEVWGAQGGSAMNLSTNNITDGGYGGYSVGVIKSTANDKYFIYVGGGGNNANSGTYMDYITVGNGYNGGTIPSSQYWSGASTCVNTNYCVYIAGGGGGTTHIATVSGVLKNLSAFKDTGGTNISKEILIVAGGGGGSTGSSNSHSHLAIGGNGGGYTGNSGIRSTAHNRYGTGGSQTGGGSAVSPYPNRNDISGFGYGCSPQADPYYSLSSQGGSGTGGLVVGGGGGWYGGGCGTHGGGGGGSGYIGSSNLISSSSITKHMTCHSCTPSAATNTNTYTISNTTTPTSTATADVARIGNGFARITYLGASI